MIEMIRRFLRQKSRSVGTMVILAVFAIPGGLAIAASGDAASLQSAGFLVVLVLGAALISRDASSGGLQMILVRPIRRTDYLFGRYLGLLAAFGVFLVVSALFAVAVRLIWKASGPPLSPAHLAENLAYGLLWAAQMGAVLVFFSSFLSGWGDVLALIGLEMLLSIQGLPDPYSKIAQSMRRELLPTVPWEKVFRGDLPALSTAGRGVLATALFLTAAAVIFARREFAYGQD